MRTILAIMLCTALGGCMTTQYTWEKPGNDQSEFKRANYRCMQEAQQRVTNVYDGSGYSVMRPNEQLYVMCMQADGYTASKVVRQ